MKKIIMTTLFGAIISISGSMHAAVKFKNKNDAVTALMKAYSASFTGTANIFDNQLKEPLVTSRWESLNYGSEYKTSRWYGTFMAFIFDDLRDYITERSTIAIKGLDKNIMASYEALVKAAKSVIDGTQQIYNDSLMKSKRNVSRVAQAGVLICGLRTEIAVAQKEENNGGLIKLAKEFGTSSSKKDAIFVLQQLAVIIETMAQKIIRDVAIIAKDIKAELPPCCSTAIGSNKICQTIEMLPPRKPGFIPGLTGPQSKNLAPVGKPSNVNSKVTEGMSMDDYNYE